MKDHGYTRDKAVEAVNRVRAASPALIRQLTTEEQEDRRDAQLDRMTCDGIMFRGKRLSSKEYMALPASEKARWQDEINSSHSTR